MVAQKTAHQKRWHREVRPNYCKEYSGQRVHSRLTGRGGDRRVDPDSQLGVRLPWPTKWQALGLWEQQCHPLLNLFYVLLCEIEYISILNV